MMVFRHAAPGPPLDGFVELLWLCDAPPQPYDFGTAQPYGY